MKKKIENLSKGQIILNLKKKLKNFIVPNLFIIKVADWEKNKKKILDEIKKKFIFENYTEKLAIRSSSDIEDGKFESSAGKFLSFLNINTNNDREITSSINKVIRSYKEKKTKRSTSEVIIQEMIQKTLISGVIFTYEINKGLPYYVINYDDVSGKTDTVTSGKGNYANKTLYVFREKISELKSNRFKLLLLAVRELEKVLSKNYLDIEFGIDQNLNIYLFQVRRITLSHKWKKFNLPILRKKLDKIKILINKEMKPKKNIFGGSNVFGQMPDWNPAEIIGEYPKPMSYSLYKTLITNQVWSDARSEMGYFKPKQKNLMVNFCGYPYIDTRLSLNSFLPAKIKKETCEKLVNFWIEKLKKNPQLHDKIEFDLAITSFSLEIEDRIDELIGNTISSSERNKFKAEIKRITLLNLKPKYKTSIQNTLKKTEHLKKLQKKYDLKDSLSNLKKLIDDCKKYGTKPFAILARHGFIAISFLRSFEKLQILSKKDISKFLMTIKTISSDFIRDIEKFSPKNKSNFLKKYGHLRPGTYDILSEKYSDSFEFRKKKTIKKIYNRKFVLSKKKKSKLDRNLKNFKIHLSANEVLDYCEKAIIAREYSKFIFTKSLSHIIDRIIIFGDQNNITKNDLSFLTIDDILRKSLNLQRLEKIIKKNKSYYNQNYFLKFPQLITKANDAYISPYQFNNPNFITTKKIYGRIKFIDKNLIKSNLDDKIILIESADPGYDWIFTHKIKGLITKYGGTNSHMAIRCAEFNLAAAIGCGEKFFNQIKGQKNILLNCLEKKIIIPNI